MDNNFVHLYRCPTCGCSQQYNSIQSLWKGEGCEYQAFWIQENATFTLGYRIIDLHTGSVPQERDDAE